MIEAQNIDGNWVEAIPKPYYCMIKVECPKPECLRRFWTEEGYKGHYALIHILRLD